MNDCGKCANVTGIKSLKTLEIVCGKGHQPVWITPTNKVGTAWGWVCETCGDDFTPKASSRD